MRCWSLFVLVCFHYEQFNQSKEFSKYFNFLCRVSVCQTLTITCNCLKQVANSVHRLMRVSESVTHLELSDKWWTVSTVLCECLSQWLIWNCLTSGRQCPMSYTKVCVSHLHNCNRNCLRKVSDSVHCLVWVCVSDSSETSGRHTYSTHRSVHWPIPVSTCQWINQNCLKRMTYTVHCIMGVFVSVTQL